MNRGGCFLDLREGQARREAFLGFPVEQAVVFRARPFREPQRRAVKESARRAGLDVPGWSTNPRAARPVAGPFSIRMNAASDRVVLV
jgi:hypothetical protein